MGRSGSRWSPAGATLNRGTPRQVENENSFSRLRERGAERDVNWMSEVSVKVVPFSEANGEGVVHPVFKAFRAHALAFVERDNTINPRHQRP